MTVTASRFLRACRGEPVDCTPVWLMRQAGRYLPEYRDVRSRASFRELLEQPELATEVTLQPMRRFELDAAIIFSDILVVTEAMGVPFEIEERRGPVLSRTVRTHDDLSQLREVDAERDFAPLLKAIGWVVNDLPPGKPLIGFAGAPFTLACYLVEGGPSKEFTAMRRLCYREPELAHALLDRVAAAVIASLRAQVAAGVSAVQLFDTWASSLSPALFAQFALPPIQRIMAGLADLGVPRILYVGGTGYHLPLLARSGADVWSVDWRVTLDQAARHLEGNPVLQGNLDPCALYLEAPLLRREITAVLDSARDLRGHIFNLGHGVLPDVPPDHVAVLVDAVHAHQRT